MIYIEKNKFQMGSDISEDEQPIREVTLEAYYIDKYPVTNLEFLDFINSNGYKNKEYWCNEGWEYIIKNRIEKPCYWDDPKWNKPEYPVTGISWYEAKAYASFIKKELPTEAQWEFAAKGVTNRVYPWGNEEASLDYANYAPGCMADRNREPQLSNHYKKNKSATGCHDMAGNFFEWCLDSFSENYEWDNQCCNPVYISNINNIKIARGGSGLHDEDYMRCSARDSYAATIRDNLFTIRCVKNIKQNTHILKTPRIEKKPSSLLYYQEEAPKNFDIKLWKLSIYVNNKEYQLSYDEILSLPQTTISRRMMCVCNWSIRRTWTGVYLKELFEHLNIKVPQNMYLKQTSIGNRGKPPYESTMKFQDALDNNSMLIHSVDGEPLSMELGYPLRFYNFALLAYKSVKALKSLEITNKYELGYWEEKAGYELEGIIRKKKYYFVDLNSRKFIKNEGEVKEF